VKSDSVSLSSGSFVIAAAGSHQKRKKFIRRFCSARCPTRLLQQQLILKAKSPYFILTDDSL
jgi:hypothetical protein